MIDSDKIVNINLNKLSTYSELGSNFSAEEFKKELEWFVSFKGLPNINTCNEVFGLLSFIITDNLNNVESIEEIEIRQFLKDIEIDYQNIYVELILNLWCTGSRVEKEKILKVLYPNVYIECTEEESCNRRLYLYLRSPEIENRD